MCTTTAANVRISGFSLKSYLSSGKSLAMVRMRRFTEAKWPRMDCAVVRWAPWPRAGREARIRRTGIGSRHFVLDTESSWHNGRGTCGKVIPIAAQDECGVFCPRNDAATSLDPKRRGQQAEGQGDGEVNDFQNAMYRNSDNAERQQQEPNEGIGDQGQNRERPAEYEQNAPEQEGKHAQASCTMIRPAGSKGSAPGVRPLQDESHEFTLRLGVSVPIATV